MSSRAYQAGDTIGPFQETLFVKEISREGGPETRLEAVLQALKPDDIVSRGEAIFAFNSVAECTSFYRSEADSGRFRDKYSAKAYYYEISLREAHRAPFQATSHALKLIRNNLPAEAVIEEYWRPTREWLVWEFLGRSAIVLRRLPTGEDDRGAMLMQLTEDRASAEKYWPAS